MYVDDILISGTSTEAVKELITSLNQKFALKDFGVVDYFLGSQVKHTTETTCITDLLCRAKMQYAKAVNAPTISGLQLTPYRSELYRKFTEVQKCSWGLAVCYSFKT